MPMRRREVSPPTMLPPGEERLIRQRLRTVIQLAITIGRREGLLSSAPVADDCVKQTGDGDTENSQNTQTQDSSKAS
jgi:hypothetical protein